MKIKYLCSLWGMDQPTLKANLKKIKEAGFDGVEMGAPLEKQKRKDLRSMLKELDLDFVAQQWTRGESPQEHAASFEEQARNGAKLKPLLINSQAGKDYYSTQDNLAIIAKTQELEEELGVIIAHEIHRTRMTYSTNATMAILDEKPDIKLTADLSHWCVVHESLLQDQYAQMARALERCVHIHARVGQPEAPQVSDPRAPEWQEAVDVHVQWWQEIVEANKRRGAKMLTICTEFGPPRYLPVMPYTRQPVANLWEINVWMCNLLKERLVA
jgi:sugar phosphate isomerase/epimerase